MTKPADSGQIAKARRKSEIAEREKKATKGPWNYHSGDDNGFYPHDSELEVGIYSPDNSAFIAHARADIPFLLSELASERQAVIEECAKVAENMVNSEFSDGDVIAAAIRSME